MKITDLPFYKHANSEPPSFRDFCEVQSSYYLWDLNKGSKPFLRTKVMLMFIRIFYSKRKKKDFSCTTLDNKIASQIQFSHFLQENLCNPASLTTSLGGILKLPPFLSRNIWLPLPSPPKSLKRNGEYKWCVCNNCLLKTRHVSNRNWPSSNFSLL